MKVILKSVVASLAVMSLAACSNNDLYDEGVVAANKTAEQQKSYENNFVKTYGAIAPNQSWDFSTNQQRLGTRAGETAIVTKTVEGLNFDVTTKLDANGMALVGIIIWIIVLSIRTKIFLTMFLISLRTETSILMCRKLFS